MSAAISRYNVRVLSRIPTTLIPPGAPGSTGATGPGYGGTSPSSLSITNSASRTFTTQAGLAYSVGTRIRASEPGGAWMEGVVTSYSGTTLIATMDLSFGSGTFSSWNISVAGNPGVQGNTGPTGAGYGGTSTSSLSITNAASRTFVTQAGLAYQTGARVRATESGGAWMEGVVTSYSGTSLIVAMDLSSGGGTFASWTLNIAGNPGIPGREVLTANRAYFVRPDGNDANDGLANTSGQAFLTLGRAVTAAYSVDGLNAFSVTVNVADGTYTGGVSAAAPFATLLNNVLIIVGNTTTPANCLVSVTAGNCFSAISGARLQISGFEVRTTTSGNCLNSAGASSQIIVNGNFVFGACAGRHRSADNGAQININTNFTISGAAAHHIWTGAGSRQTVTSRTITITGTPAFSGAFAFTHLAGATVDQLNTYSGSATGTRYLVEKNGVIDTNAGGASYFPGSVAGSAATGGQYI